MISLLVPWASCSLVTGIKSDCFGGCCHLLKRTVLHSPACVCATMCFKGARGFLVTKNDYRLPAFVLFGKLFLHSVLLVCNRSETSLKPKEPNVQVAFLFGFFFYSWEWGWEWACEGQAPSHVGFPGLFFGVRKVSL